MKSINKLIALSLVLCLGVTVLTSCSFFGVSISSAPSPSASAPASPSPEESASPAASPALTVDPGSEPPLEDYIKALAVPDFLDEEQQNLYRRAYALYFLFRGDTSAMESYPLPDGTRLERYGDKTVAINGMEYSVAQGRYKNWNDFRSVLLCVFTEEYFNKMNGQGGTEIYVEKDGTLCYLNAAMGSDPRYFGEDAFELISKTDTEIRFNVIGSFHGYMTGGDTALEKDVKEGGDFTAAFPLTLTKTSDGWRFSEFSKTH